MAASLKKLMACPFFMPTEKCADGGWIHPTRLPLGAGWQGYCCAPGHEGAAPNLEEVREFCNLGYASRCLRLPKQRTVDAVRFSVTRDRGDQLAVCFVRELGHRPADHGALEYDRSFGKWMFPPADPCIQRMAECYLQSYLSRRIRPVSAGSIVSTDS